jgi:hypothetical protein
MVELAVLLSLTVIAGAAATKLYEWRQDVLYGPYIRRDDRYEAR